MTLASANRRTSRSLAVNAAVLEDRVREQVGGRGGHHQAGLVQRLAERGDPLRSRSASAGLEVEHVVVVEVHPVGAELGELAHGALGGHRRPDRAAEHVHALPADRPDAEREPVLRGRYVASAVTSRSLLCRCRGRGLTLLSTGRPALSLSQPACPSPQCPVGVPGGARRALADAARSSVCPPAGAGPVGRLRRARPAPRRPAGPRRARRTPPARAPRPATPKMPGASARTRPRTGPRRRSAAPGAGRRPAPRIRSAASASEHEHGLDRGPGQVLPAVALRVVRPREHAGRVRPVRGALAVQVGQQRRGRPRRARRPAPGRTARPGRRRSAAATAESTRRRVDRGDQRQEPAGRVGEPGDHAGRVGRGRAR